MRKRKATIVTVILLIALGIAAILIGIYAYQLGLDNNPVMGNKRKILIALGACLLLLLPLLAGLKRAARRLGLPARWPAFINRWQQTRFVLWLNSLEGRPFSRFMRRHAWIYAVLASLIVIVTALWYITAGTITQWTPYSRYYDRQADAFLAGQLALLDQPPAELAQVKNLYDWKAREGINYLWDASYYQGKYYIYWGPVPALVAAGIKFVHPGVVEDQVLVLIFISGLAIVMGALFHWLRKTYFPSAPCWTVLLFTLTALLCTPVFWLVNRPSVYEAAIASAQFFLSLGIYAVLRGATPAEKKPGWLILAGFSLAATVGSRFSNAVTVVLFSLIVMVPLLKDIGKKGWKLSPLLSFGLPLAVGAVALAAFNYARFGSIFETGLRYQLTGEALPVDRSLLFSIGYFSPNLYSSLLRPLQLTPGQFPFFTTPFVLDNMWPNFVHRPKTYYSGEPVAGVLATIPFLWLLVLPLIKWARSLLAWVNERPQPAAAGDASPLPVWAAWALALAALSQFATNMSFVMTTERYLADFTPLLILCTALLVWYACARLKPGPGWRRFLLFLTFLLCTATICIGLLTNMQGADHRFETNNPHLYAQIAAFFERYP